MADWALRAKCLPARRLPGNDAQSLAPGEVPQGPAQELCAAVHTPAAGSAMLAACVFVEGLFMSEIQALASSASCGWFGFFRSWLQAPSNENGPAADAPAQSVIRPAVPGWGAVRVLAVDDNPVNRMLISALLQSSGVVPELADDGAQAVARACAERFDLILMDLQMPVMDGLAATSAIRRFEALQGQTAVPVLAYSGLPVSADLLAAHGLNGSLAKPCGIHELEDCLFRWCPTFCAAPTARSVYGNKR